MTAAPDGHYRYAGLVTRVASLIVDIAVVTTLVTVGTGIFVGVWEAFFGTLGHDGKIAVAAVAAMVPWLYFTLFWWLLGRTPGNMILGVKVLRSNGKPLHLLRAAARAILGIVLALVWLVGLVSIAFDARRRALHDKVFRTVVVYIREQDPPSEDAPAEPAAVLPVATRK